MNSATCLVPYPPPLRPRGLSLSLRAAIAQERPSEAAAEDRGVEVTQRPRHTLPHGGSVGGSGSGGASGSVSGRVGAARLWFTPSGSCPGACSSAHAGSGVHSCPGARLSSGAGSNRPRSACQRSAHRDGAAC